MPLPSELTQHKYNDVNKAKFSNICKIISSRTIGTSHVTSLSVDRELILPLLLAMTHPSDRTVLVFLSIKANVVTKLANTVG